MPYSTVISLSLILLLNFQFSIAQSDDDSQNIIPPNLIGFLPVASLARTRFNAEAERNQQQNSVLTDLNTAQQVSQSQPTNQWEVLDRPANPQAERAKLRQQQAAANAQTTQQPPVFNGRPLASSDDTAASQLRPLTSSLSNGNDQNQRFTSQTTTNEILRVQTGPGGQVQQQQTVGIANQQTVQSPPQQTNQQNAWQPAVQFTTPPSSANGWIPAPQFNRVNTGQTPQLAQPTNTQQNNNGWQPAPQFSPNTDQALKPIQAVTNRFSSVNDWLQGLSPNELKALNLPESPAAPPIPRTADELTTLQQLTGNRLLASTTGTGNGIFGSVLNSIVESASQQQQNRQPANFDPNAGLVPAQLWSQEQAPNIQQQLQTFGQSLQPPQNPANSLNFGQLIPALGASALPSAGSDPLSSLLQLGLSNVLGSVNQPKVPDQPQPDKNKDYGEYAGQLIEDKTVATNGNYYNCKGGVYVVDEHTLLVSQFTFQPNLFAQENVTFWAGPRIGTGDTALDMFPSVNGVYLTTEPLKVKPGVPGAPGEKKVIIAKRPTATEIGNILKNKDAKRETQTTKPETKPTNDSTTTMMPKPEPEPSATTPPPMVPKAEPTAVTTTTTMMPKPEPEPKPGRRKRDNILSGMDFYSSNGAHLPYSLDSENLVQLPSVLTRINSNYYRTAKLEEQDNQRNVEKHTYFKMDEVDGITTTTRQPVKRGVISLIVDKGTIDVPASDVISASRQFSANAQADLRPQTYINTVTTNQVATPSSTSFATASTTFETQPRSAVQPFDILATGAPNATTFIRLANGSVVVGTDNTIVAGQTPTTVLITSTDNATTTALLTTTTTTIAPPQAAPPKPWESLTWNAGFAPMLLRLPDNMNVKDVKWLSVWHHTKLQSIASVLIPNSASFHIPSAVRVKGLESTGFRDIGSGPIEILDAKTIRINNFHFEGDAPGAWFMVGKDYLPNPFGQIVPIASYDAKNGTTYSCEFLKAYNNATVTLHLPGDMTVKDVFWLSVFCVPYAISFAHVYLPYNDLHVPPTFITETVPNCVLDS